MYVFISKLARIYIRMYIHMYTLTYMDLNSYEEEGRRDDVEDIKDDIIWIDIDIHVYIHVHIFIYRYVLIYTYFF
jgi:hypothetical protein